MIEYIFLTLRFDNLSISLIEKKRSPIINHIFFKITFKKVTILTVKYPSFLSPFSKKISPKFDKTEEPNLDPSSDFCKMEKF